MADKYIDSNWTGAGTAGTEADPYKTITASGVNALAGDQSGDTCYIKYGSTFTGEAIANTATNWNIRAYGDPKNGRPVIDGNYAVNYCVSLTGTNIIVRDIYVKQANVHNILIANGTDNVHLVNIVSGDCTSASGTGNNIQINGVNGAGKLTNSTIQRCECFNPKNNGIEMSFNDGTQILDCYIHNCEDGNLIEPWEDNANVIVRRTYGHTSSATGNFINSKGNGGTTDDTFTIENCYAWDVARAVYVTNGSTWTCQNNSFQTRRGGFRVDTGINHNWNGNILYFVPDTGQENNNIVQLAAGVTCTFSNNVYWQTSGNSSFRWNGAATLSFATWKTNSGSDAASLEEDPKLTSPTTGDFTLDDTSPCLYTNLDAATTVTSDFNQDARYGGDDVGALQKQRHPTVTATKS